MDFNQQAKELLDPIMDLMSGADGGVGFAKLRHDFLPAMLEKSANGGALEAELVLVVTRMSVLCKTLMED